MRVAVAREVGADVRDAAGAERADRVRRGAVRHFLVGQLLARGGGRQAARHQVPHALGALAAADADVPAHPHQVEHAGDVAGVRPSAGLPADLGAVLDVTRAQRALPVQTLEDVGAEVGLGVPPVVLLGAPGAALGRLHRVAVDREVLAEHIGGLVRPVLEERALAVGELLEQRLVEGAVAAEEDQQVVAGDDRGRVQLQAAQGPDGVEQVLGARLGAGRRPGEPLVADRQPADGGRIDLEHPPQASGGRTGRRRRGGRSRSPRRTTRWRRSPHRRRAARAATRAACRRSA